MSHFGLIRVYHACTQQVDSDAHSLHADAAFLLLNVEKKQLAVWVGTNCGRVDRAIAENLGAEITRDEFHQSIASTHIPVSLQCHPPHPLILSMFGISSVVIDQSVSTNTNAIINDDIYLSALVVRNDEPSLSNKLILTQSCSAHNGTKISFSDFKSESVYLYECGSSERYLWIGSKLPRKMHKRIIDYAQANPVNPMARVSSSVTVIRDGLEPILFLEKFLHIHEAFPKNRHCHRSGDSGVKSSVPKKAIASEVPRMVSSMFGTLQLVTQGLGTDGGVIKMAFLQDLSAEAAVWRVTGATRSLTPVPLDQRGIFFSSGCYALLFRLVCMIEVV
jgi:hypothetical protein